MRCAGRSRSPIAVWRHWRSRSIAEPLRCSLNVSFHFPGLPLEASLDGAAAAGFHTIELLDPYKVPLDELEHALRRRGLRLDLFNLPMGDFAAGDRGIAGDPDRRHEFRRGVEQAVGIAEQLSVARVNALVGRRNAVHAETTQLECLLEQLAWAAERLASVGVAVNSELLNPVETPGLLLPDLAGVRAVIASLDGLVGLQLDIYHLQRTQGELLPTISACSEITRHVQIADAPDRTEPGSGEINYQTVLAAVAATGYDGLVGCEYRPSRPDIDPFAWMERLNVVKA
jgi:hydroxypyruvate isomerase